MTKSMGTGNKIDWFAFGLHFFCGAVLGILAGLFAWGKSDHAVSDFWSAGVYYAVGGALALGLLAGLGGQSFWENVRTLFRW
jgi:hypothetical protein